MNTKKIGLSIILGGMLSFLLILLGRISFTEYQVVYEVEYEKASNTQLFFADELEKEYTEEKSILADVKGKKNQHVETYISKENEKIRIDLGYIKNSIELNEASIKALGSTFPLKENQIVDKNQVQSERYKDGSFTFEVDGDDPHVVFNVSDTLIQLEEKTKEYNTIISILYVMLGIISAGIVYWKYEKVKKLVLWLFSIFKEWKLIWNLAVNDFKMRYVTSYLGIIWAFIQPVVTILIYVIVFGMGFKSLPVEGVSFAVWLTTGIVPWFFFQEAWMSATNSLLEYSYLVKKVVFKINVLPMVKITASVFVHLFFIALAVVLQLLFGMPVHIQLIQVVYYTFCVMVLVLGLSYITAALVVFLKDIGQIVNILLQFGMWLTPIMYKADMFGHTGERILKLNPMFYIVDGYRDAFFQQQWFWEKPQLTLYFWCVTGIILLIGIKVFKSLEKHFADVL